MKINKESKICISIIVTGKCNCDCEYCHFYASHDRKKYNRNIDLKLFNRYIDYINYLKTKVKEIKVRFSGGEPLYMGEDLWKLTNELYAKTGIKPYIMTNGKLLNKKIAQKAKDNNVSAFVVSIENPFDNIRGTEKTIYTLSRIIESKEVNIPILFGMLVVQNREFKDLYRIAEYFYKKVKMIPPMCEVNYLPYISPTKEEFKQLYNNTKKIVKKYNGVCDISLFPYIIPEYYSNNLDGNEYLTEFPIDDKHNMLNLSNSEIIVKTQSQINKSYAEFDCKDTNCDWYGSCKRIKWVWNMDTKLVSKERKNQDYCEFKKVLSNAFYDALYEGE